MIQTKSNNNSPSNKYSTMSLNWVEVQNLIHLAQMCSYLTPSVTTQPAQDHTSSITMLIHIYLDAIQSAQETHSISLI
jgi:SUMO ligase MMS21 Smc5/6 complex component